MDFSVFALCCVIQFDHLQVILTSGVSAVAAFLSRGGAHHFPYGDGEHKAVSHGLSQVRDISSPQHEREMGHHRDQFVKTTMILSLGFLSSSLPGISYHK